MGDAKMVSGAMGEVDGMAVAGADRHRSGEVMSLMWIAVEVLKEE